MLSFRRDVLDWTAEGGRPYVISLAELAQTGCGRFCGDISLRRS